MPGLKREFDALHGDLPAFFRRMRELAEMPAARRDALVCGEAPSG